MRFINLNSTVLGCICAMGCETIYGLSYMFTKQATECAGVFALLGWRFVIAAFFMSLLIRFGLVKIDLNGLPMRQLMIISIFSPCIYFVAETIGINSTSSSESGVFMACIPVVSLYASAVILGKKPSWLQTLGIFITLAGVIITVFAVEAAAHLSVLGYACLTLAVISYALYSVFVDLGADHTGANITYVMLMVGAGVFSVAAVAEALYAGNLVGLITLPFSEIRFLTAVLYQGIGCSVLALFLANVAVTRIGVNRTASFIGVSTVVSIGAGAAFMNESFTTLQMVGAAVIMLGVYFANIPKAISECE